MKMNLAWFLYVFFVYCSTFCFPAPAIRNLALLKLLGDLENRAEYADNTNTNDYGTQEVVYDARWPIAEVPVIRTVEKRRWLFPTQKVSSSSLYPTMDCTDDLNQMMNTFRRMPRGKERDAMVAALYNYCNTKST